MFRQAASSDDVPADAPRPKRSTGDKALWVLLALIPTFYLGGVLAGLLDLDLGVALCLIGMVLALVGSGFVATILFCHECSEKFWKPPKWDDAKRLYPVPGNSTGRLIGRNLLIQDIVRAKFYRCRMRAREDGVLVSRPNFPLLFPRDAIFVPWDALQATAEIAVPWYVSVPLTHAMQIAIHDTQLSLVISVDTWNEHFAAHVRASQ